MKVDNIYLLKILGIIFFLFGNGVGRGGGRNYLQRSTA